MKYSEQPAQKIICLSLRSLSYELPTERNQLFKTPYISKIVPEGKHVVCIVALFQCDFIQCVIFTRD